MERFKSLFGDALDFGIWGLALLDGPLIGLVLLKPLKPLAITMDTKWDGDFIRTRGETGTPQRRDRASWNWRSGLDDSQRCLPSSSHRMIDRTPWHIDSG